jgi:hypothetical protein
MKKLCFKQRKIIHAKYQSICKKSISILYSYLWLNFGPGSVVGIETGYGLDGSGIDPGGGEIFRTCPHRPWGPPSLLYNGYHVFPGGKERSGSDADPSPTSSAVGHERVELYLYSSYGPYGLYRASVPVKGCTLLFHLYDWIYQLHFFL